MAESSLSPLFDRFSPTTTIHQQQQQQLPSNKTLRKSLFQHIFGALRCTQ